MACAFRLTQVKAVRCIWSRGPFLFPLLLTIRRILSLHFTTPLPPPHRMVTTTTDGACRPVAGVSAGGGAGLCPRMPRLDRMVNRSFRKVEKAADWLMGSAGPIFVGLAILLVSIGAWTFCKCAQSIAQPQLDSSPDCMLPSVGQSSSSSPQPSLLTLPPSPFHSSPSP